MSVESDAGVPGPGSDSTNLPSSSTAFRCVLRPLSKSFFVTFFSLSWNWKVFLPSHTFFSFGGREAWKDGYFSTHSRDGREEEKKPFFINPYQIVWQLTVTIFSSVISEWILTILKNLQGRHAAASSVYLATADVGESMISLPLRFLFRLCFYSSKSKAKPYINFADHIELRPIASPSRNELNWLEGTSITLRLFWR